MTNKISQNLRSYVFLC